MSVNPPLEGWQVINLLHSGIDVTPGPNIEGVQNLTYTLSPNYLLAGNSTVIEASRPLLTTKTDTSKIALPILLIGGLALAILLLK